MIMNFIFSVMEGSIGFGRLVLFYWINLGYNGVFMGFCWGRIFIGAIDIVHHSSQRGTNIYIVVNMVSSMYESESEPLTYTMADLKPPPNK